MAVGETPWQKWRPYVLLAAAVLFAFGRALEAPFHFDDHSLAVTPTVTSPSGWLDIFLPTQTRPLTYLTFWATYQLGGANPAGYHAVNLALHAVSSFLVWLCLGRLMPARAAMIAAFVFAIHPIQTEAVVYVFARSSVLAACLTFAALHAWLRGRHWMAVAWFASALLAKEEVAAFPVFLALLHNATARLARERAPIAAMLALSLAAVARVAWVAATTPGSGAGTQAGVSPWAYFLTQGYAILRYLQMLAVPVGFTVDPDIPVLTDWRGALCWITVASMVYTALLFTGRLRAGFWFVAALILIAPTSSVFPAADLAADRRVYLPMLAFAAIAGLLLERTQYDFLLVAGGVVLAMLSFTRTDVWLSEPRLWEDAMQWAPEKARPRVQLARVSPPAQALEYLLDAKRIAPDDALVASELGKVFLERKQPSEALVEFGRAVAIEPRNALSLNNRAVALAMLSMHDLAIADLQQALAVDPCLLDARRNLRDMGQPTPIPPQCRVTPEQRRTFKEGR
ncbi:MAG: glycosyltransferase family 39 protein [Bryobacterales bacterium]|nr:glycosyltransferase family 39 protein [Bryobacterales bacterium]